MSSTNRRAAVNHDSLAGRKRAGLRGQEHRSACDFVGLANAQQWRARGGRLSVSGLSHSALAKSVLIRPGAMQFTRMLCLPYSQARLRASCMSAALEIA